MIEVTKFSPLFRCPPEIPLMGSLHPFKPLGPTLWIIVPRLCSLVVLPASVWRNIFYLAAADHGPKCTGFFQHSRYVRHQRKAVAQYLTVNNHLLAVKCRRSFLPEVGMPYQFAGCLPRFDDTSPWCVDPMYARHLLTPDPPVP